VTEVTDQRSGVSKSPALSAMFFALCFLSAVLVSVPFVEAQRPKKVPQIGFLSESKGLLANGEAFMQGLRKLGHIEGQNISIERRYTMGDAERIPRLIAELIQLKVDAIFAPGTAVALSAKNATQTIPIVFASVSDAVGSGLVASLAKPGGNATGLTQISPDLAGKRLEILTEVVPPRLSRVAVLIDRSSAASALSLSETKIAARALSVQLQTVEVAGVSAFDRAFQTMTEGRAGALVVISTPMFVDESRRIADLAKKHRLPAMYTLKEYVDSGGLMSYGVSLPDLFRRAATYVDKILKGAKPADLPVEQPTKFEFIINLKAAKQIGLTIPANLLLRADKVIK
jgi:putative tryptophan/tyrosine transport system substrate-binding protein